MVKMFSICDTTLRDGEQMPGVVFKPEQKIELAQRFSDFGVDIIELMPSVSKIEMQTAKEIANMGLKSEITASTMLRKSHVDIALNSNLGSVTLFTAMSDIQLKHSVNMSREENKQKSMEIVEYARSHGLKINFAGADCTRADMNYIIDFLDSMKGYISYFMACDTLGCMTPMNTRIFFQTLCDNTKIPIALHAHNDFGLATANTLSGLEAGAKIFSGTFNGIGERAGNTPIEEVLVSLKYLYGVDPKVKFHDMSKICNIVQNYSGIQLQKHKPLVGANAFCHESGIHVDGILKNTSTFEPFDPSTIGMERKIVFGKHSGKNGIMEELKKMSLDVDVRTVLDMVKEESQRQKRAVSIEEILGLEKVI